MADKEKRSRVAVRRWATLPKLTGIERWSPDRGGSSNIPGTLPYFARIMDHLSRGKPVSSTYTALWCRLCDASGSVTITDPAALARESGFSGPRSVSVWRSRMGILVKQGWIRAHKFGDEKYGYVLVVNPYLVAKGLYDEERIDDALFHYLLERHYEVGSTDLDELVAENGAEG